MKLGIAAFPSKKLQDMVNSYRMRYDPHYKLIPPHLTLKSSFERDEKELAGIVETLQKTAAQFAPFKLEVLKVSTFQPVNNVIYLKVDPNPSLLALHEQLNTDLKQEEKYNFVPHITLAQNLSNDEHSDVFGQMSLLQLRHEEMIDRIHLLYQLENGSWTVYETFRLEKETNA
ncbi:MAG: YjcG family protein [Bacillus sp. (in: firmicutes)]